MRFLFVKHKFTIPIYELKPANPDEANTTTLYLWNNDHSEMISCCKPKWLSINIEETGCFSDSCKFFRRDKSCCVKNADEVRWAAAATGEEMTSETVDYCLSEWPTRNKAVSRVKCRSNGNRKRYRKKNTEVLEKGELKWMYLSPPLILWNGLISKLFFKALKTLK